MHRPVLLSSTPQASTLSASTSLASTLRSSMLLASSLLFVACSHPPPPAPPPASAAPGRSMMSEAEALRDRMCACTTMECAQGVFTDVSAFGDRYGDLTGTPEEQAALEAVVAELAACNERLVAATPPAP